MKRCCLCRARPPQVDLDISDLPGSGWQCIDREACKARVADIVNAHRTLPEILG